MLAPARLEDITRRLADVGVAVTVLLSTDLYLMAATSTTTSFEALYRSIKCLATGSTARRRQITCSTRSAIVR